MPWYQNWFESNFYDNLYKHRDEEEAYSFVRNIFGVLTIPENASIIDLACGNGRHAEILSKFGNVVGLDLSKRQILKAKNRNISNAEFHVHDMRDPFQANSFDFIFNFFSSFGYFNSVDEDLKVLESVCFGLKPGGYFIQDFLNPTYVLAHLKETDTKIEDGVRYDIIRALENNQIVKSIKVTCTDNKVYDFEERVCAYTMEELCELHTKAKLKIVSTYGDYDLSAFDEISSPRSIVVSKKEENV